ncbi:MAG: hypothetical protein ABIQ10_03355 [Gemmatimonadaceae bacterium]
MAKMIGDMKEYEAKQHRAAAKKPAKLIAQLAAPIMAALINARRDRSDADIASRAVELAQILHETAIAKTMERQALRARVAVRSVAPVLASEAPHVTKEQLYAAALERAAAVERGQMDREVPLPSGAFHSDSAQAPR